jgi:Zn-dependent protease
MITQLLIRMPVVVFSLVIHEYMHGYVAWRCGDDTALRAGRLTLNPLPHLDLIGTLCLMFAPIGWAKPVPVNPYNFNRPRRDEILVSGAGVAANFLVAAVLALTVRFLVAAHMGPQPGISSIAWAMMSNAILINFGLFVFNLVPVYPLDGSHILKELLPARLAIRFGEISRYGIFLLIGVVLLNRYTGFLLWPVIMLTLGFAGVDGTREMVAFLS